MAGHSKWANIKHRKAGQDAKRAKEFNKLTKIPVLINTSFNLNGEPIVCSPEDAIRTFYTCGLDILVLGDYVIEK